MRNIRMLLAVPMVCVVLSACGESVSPIASVQISNAPATLEVGESVPLSAQALDERGEPFADVRWSATPLGVVSVNATGVVTATGQGTGVVSATAGNRTASVTVSVLRSAVAQLTVSALPGTLATGSTAQLSVIVKDARGGVLTERAVTWSSNAPTIADVDNVGIVRALSPGTATIAAFVEGKSSTTQVTVAVGSVSLSLSPKEASVGVGQLLPFRVMARDTLGNEVASPSSSWSSSVPTVATVSTSGVVTTTGPGSTFISATVGSTTLTALIFVNAVATDMIFWGTNQLNGHFRYHTVTVGHSATVTAGRELRIESDGDLNIDGTINGSCSSITLISKGRITVHGKIDNPCPATIVSQAGGLRVIAAEGFDIGFRPAGFAALHSISTAGHQLYTTDSTLTNANFAAGAPRSNASTECVFDRARIVSPGRARDGIDGQFGSNGADGGSIIIECGGTIQLRGNVQITSQSGGNGGHATHSTAGNAIAIGGKGGRSGTIRMRATGDLLSGNSLTDGRGPAIDIWAGSPGGGNGGTATATSVAASGGVSSATAIGGDAGDVGFVGSGGESVLLHANGFIMLTETELAAFQSGAGGNAIAIGANGLDAGSQPARSGGNALARGGRSGRMAPAVASTGAGASGQGRVLVIAGSVSKGGSATATAGNGGNGNEAFPAGAPGGSVSAFGGDGADNGYFFASNYFLVRSPVPGGAGGAATISGGNGGMGYSRCGTTGGSSGSGGRGGTGTGSGGRGGSNALGAPTVAAVLTVNNAGNGGRGGNGVSPGTGGENGLDGTTPIGSRVSTGMVFNTGAVGGSCP